MNETTWYCPKCQHACVPYACTCELECDDLVYEVPVDQICSVCSGPFHEATGYRASATMRWCGPCTRKWVKELVGHTSRRWGGHKFYEHARVPPPAKYYFFTFVAGPVVVTELGVHEDEAYSKCRDLIPNRNDITIVACEEIPTLSPELEFPKESDEEYLARERL